jgi:ATP-dependent DNA helicase RecG
MPSALETLVKILKLEREQGCKNTAVIGGLAAYGDKWAGEAHTQAKKPEHHLLVDELSLLLSKYDALQSKGERVDSITYMLDRIMNRKPPPPEYQPATPPTVSASSPPGASPPVQREESPPRAEAANQSPPQHKEERPPRKERPPQQKMRPKEAHPPRAPVGQKPRTDEEEDEEGGIGYEAREESSFDNYDAPAPRRGGGNRAVAELDIPAPIRLARPPRRPRQPMPLDEARDALKKLKMPVDEVKGVGSGTAKLLEKLGVRTVEDLVIGLLPRRYDDYTRLRNIAHLEPDAVATVIGTVAHTEVRAGKGGRKDFFMVVDDGSARMSALFFGQHYMIRNFHVGNQVVLSGTTSIYGNRIQMINPEVEQLDSENLHTVGIVPVYPLTEGLSGKMLRRTMKNAVNYWADRLPDYVPEGTLERADLADLGWALRNLHFPESWDHLQHAQNRFIFDELLLLQLTILGNRREWQSVPAQPLDVSDEYLDSFIGAVFPYPLTGAQRRAIDDIRRDIHQPVPMNRLIQGDVGSGKTAVAIVGIAMALANGKQAALMVPTGILAEQHYRNISATLAKMPGDRKPVIALLTGSITQSEREAIYRGIADGSVDVVIGTHALIQEGVDFKDLALAIIDEQHRFGVEQRKALRGKGTNPHLLVMTATPIPRTLALTMYADLDLSVIDEMPPGRIPIQTRVIDPVARQRMYNFVESELNKGRQAFVVHPLVEASEKIEAPAALEAYEQLQQVFYRHKVGLLHGRMKPGEKDEVMEAFSSGQFDVLVTTSVAEVGVNVPNASVMIIEGANRFGLAQLHQFRGRVGRGEYASYCLLISDTNSEEARERLQVMESTNDGFKLAEMDWKLRGAGDLIGTRQSGGNKLQLVQEMTPHLVELAQREARTIYEEDPSLALEQHALLAERVKLLQDERSDVS